MSATATKMACEPAKLNGLFRSSRQRSIVVSLLLIAATLTIYTPVTRNGFVNFDDNDYVVENPHTRAGIYWPTVSWAFTSLEHANWHPLTWLSHALDCQLFGLNPLGHHYVNLLLHSLNAALLFLLLQWFTGHFLRSAAVAALFAVHPLNVESVAWIAERKNVLSLLFFLLALAAYKWYAQKPRVSCYLLVSVLFAMGLMAKPMIITLPFALLLLDFWPLRRMAMAGTASHAAPEPRARSLGWLCVEKIPLLILSVGSAVITVIAQKAGGALVPASSSSVFLRLENASVSYVKYIWKVLWPSKLAILYPFPKALPLWEALVCGALLLMVTCAVLKYRRRRYLPVGWFWFLGTMVPMIGLVQVGSQSMADRYAYLPIIGLFIMVVWVAAEFADEHRVSTRYLGLAAIGVLVTLASVSYVQLGYWHDDYRLWSRALSVTTQNAMAENNLGAVLGRQGRLDEAISHLRSAIAIDPGDPDAQFNLGLYSQQHGAMREAELRYLAVLQLTHDSRRLGAAYSNLGTVYFSLRDYPRARQSFESAEKLNRIFPITYLDLGLIAQKDGDWNRAVDNYARLVSMEPSDVGFLLLSQALEHVGRGEAAKTASERAQQLSPDMNQTRQIATNLLNR